MHFGSSAAQTVKLHHTSTIYLRRPSIPIQTRGAQSMREHGTEAARPVPAVHTCHKGTRIVVRFCSLAHLHLIGRTTVSGCSNRMWSGAAQGHAEVRIAATTCHQGNRSLPDVAAAERGLVRVHGPRDRTSSPPREQCSRQGFVGRTFSE